MQWKFEYDIFICAVQIWAFSKVRQKYSRVCWSVDVGSGEVGPPLIGALMMVFHPPHPTSCQIVMTINSSSLSCAPDQKITHVALHCWMYLHWGVRRSSVANGNIVQCTALSFQSESAVVRDPSEFSAHSAPSTARKWARGSATYQCNISMQCTVHQCCSATVQWAKSRSSLVGVGASPSQMIPRGHCCPR